MYDWKTVNSGKLCPTGWHVPSVDEWGTLTTYVGGRDIDKLKESGEAHWDYPNTRTTNESGFTALPGGYRDYAGIFHSIAGDGYWWCSTEAYTQGAFYRVMYSNTDFVLWGSWTKAMGLSVRCIKDN